MIDLGLGEILRLENALAARLRDHRIAQVDPQWLEIGKQWSQAVWTAGNARGPLDLERSDIERGLALAERPVFVCGTHRSGTTWMRNLLDGHPQLIVLPSEGAYYTSLHNRLVPLSDCQRMAETVGIWLLRLANPENQPPFWLLRRSTATVSPYVEFVRAVVAWWPIVQSDCGRRLGPWVMAVVALAFATVQAGGILPPSATAWVDKTPTNERFLALFRQDLRNARIIHMIRDPRSVIASHTALAPWSWRTGRKAAAAYRNLAASYAAALENSGEGPYLVVRYEDLAAHPLETAGRIATFLGIEDWAGLLDPTSAGQPTTPNTSFSAPQTDRTRRLGLLDRFALALTVGRSAHRLGY